MSLYVFRASFLDLSPRVWAERDQLYARSSWLAQALGLFAFSRFVHLDGRLKLVMVERRYLWFLRSRRYVRFDRVRHVEYRFSRVWTDFSAAAGPTDQIESFAVSLALRDADEDLLLFRFRGLGSVATGWYGVLFGDELIDAEGRQESTSLAFAHAVQKLIGCSLGQTPLALQLAREHGWQCSACRRPALARPGKCLYCGGALAEVAARPADR